MQQQQMGRKKKETSGAAKGSGLDVAKLRKRAEASARHSLEHIHEAEEEESAALDLRRASIHKAEHDIEHIEKAKKQRAPERLCLRRAKAGDQRRMHGGCGGLD